MHISRLIVHNYRNFADLDVLLGPHVVIVGENKIGKSNLLCALRLVLDPSLPDSARKLREEDFWDGLKRPLRKTDYIGVSVEISDFETNENCLAVLAEHLIQPEPMVARLTYRWQPLPSLEHDPAKDADYEFLVYGGDRPENRLGYEVRRRLPMELMPALRDCEADLARWTRSPLRPLLDRAAQSIDRANLESLAQGVDAATEEVTAVKEVKAIAKAIGDKLIEMVGSVQALETVLRFSPTDADKLIRALRIFIDGGRRGMSDASLGSANLLYFALKMLEYELLVNAGDRDHTFLAIEEPEAHLHPNLQRLVFRNYLHTRVTPEEKNAPSHARTILVTTHSPHIASVTPLKDFVLLRRNKEGNATEAVSTAKTDFKQADIADLERYMDVNRGEVLFARGVILVEGDAEEFLVPVLARNQGCDLDELGISVCSISGTNFFPYLLLLGPRGLNMPFAALTDFDPRKPKKDGSSRAPLGPRRVVNDMMSAVLDPTTWDSMTFDEVAKMAPGSGMFLNTHTFEVDMFKAGLQKEFVVAMNTVGANTLRKDRMRGWAADGDSLDIDLFLKDIEAVGKGRFAQRLSSVIGKAGTAACPKYILRGVKHVAEQCKRS